MAILETNTNIRRLVLQYKAYDSGKMMIVQRETETRATDLAILITTIIIFAVFLVCMASVCYRWTSRQFHSLDQSVTRFTNYDVEQFPVRRAMRIPAARGIDAAVVKSFPTFLYSEVKERRIGKGGFECAVCLCEFEDDETLRLMPVCSHVFHADCVNMWLYNHSTCPLCRVDLLFQPESDPERRVLDSPDERLLERMTWTNRNRTFQSESTRLPHGGVSEALLLFTRSNSTGHSVVQPGDHLDRFTLRLPEDVQNQLKKKTAGHVALTKARSSRRTYRSKSVGCESRCVLSREHNNRPQRSMSFSFTDCGCSTSGDRAAVTPSNILPVSIDPGLRSVKQIQSDERV